MAMDLSVATAPLLIGGGFGAAVAAWLGERSARPSGLWRRAAKILGWLTLAVAAIGWFSRLLHAGHLPLFGTYESAWSLALAILLATAAWSRVERNGIAWGVGGGVAAAVMAHGAQFEFAAYALTISEQSWVVDVHAVLAWLAFGLFTVALALAVGRLCVDGEDAALDARLALALRAAFVLHSAMLASGSFYKFLLFGSAWTFDPIETLGFAAWISYGTLLHLHLLGAWGGRRLARWSLGLFVLLVISYRGIVYFPSWSTYHIFDMDLRMHIVN